MRTISRANKLLICIISIFFILNIAFVIKGQAVQQGVTVFIIDTGIEEKYYQDNVKINEKTGHGSLVAWIISRDVNKGDINIIPIEVADSNGNIQYSLYLAGLREIIDYKMTHPHQRILVNVSLGFTKKAGYEYIKELYNLNVQLIAAAGNNNSHQPVYPAGFSREVIAVANATSEAKAESSNYGFYVDIAASGSLEYIESLYFPGQRLNRKFRFSGTSFSAPRVTALLATILVRDNDLTIKQAVDIIEETACPLKGELYKQGMLGAGIINREQALARVIDNYHLQKYVKITAIFIVIAIILLFLWQIYKIFSVFIFILLSIVLLPLLAVIGEYIDYWLLKGKKYLPYLVVIITLLYIINKLIITVVSKINNPSVILKLLFIPSTGIRTGAKKRLIEITGGKKEQLLLKELNTTDNKKKKKLLIDVLTQIKKPPLESLIHYGIQNKLIVDYLAVKIAAVDNKQRLIKILLCYLQQNNHTGRELAAEILKRLDVNLILNNLLILLKQNRSIDRETILQVIESYGVEAVEAVADVKNVLKNSNDMWTRYQAVRTLYNITIDRENILSYLKDYTDDKQQLVRLEVRELLKESSKG